MIYEIQKPSYWLVVKKDSENNKGKYCATVLEKLKVSLGKSESRYTYIRLLSHNALVHTHVCVMLLLLFEKIFVYYRVMYSKIRSIAMGVLGKN